ncbi:MAG TPA: hypothetical protein VLS51_00355 [Propionibacteriaceae bacterium]|nr:hypothetical protein [Propionibacteriaceae bacterium]
MTRLSIDCDQCAVRGLACSDCIVSALLGVPDEDLTFDDAEQAAFDALAASGMVPPLRLVPKPSPSPDRRRRGDDYRMYG